MTVCANRNDNPGFFTSCVAALGTCRCGDAVRAQPANLTANFAAVLDAALTYVPWTCSSCGKTARAVADFDVRCACGTITRAPSATEDA